MRACHVLLGTLVLGDVAPGSKPDVHDAEWVVAPRHLLEQMKAGHLHHFHPHPQQQRRASLLAETSEGASTGLVPKTSPNAHDAEWVEAPRHLLEQMKAGHLRRFHPHQRHDHASLLAEDSTGTLSGKILGDISTAEHALEHALRGAPGILQKEEGLLKQASFMATEAGNFRMREHSLNQRMSTHAEEQSSKTLQKHMSMAASQAVLRDLGKKETALIADGFGILRGTKSVKMDVVDAIGESNPKVAAQVEHLLDSAGADQKKIMRGEARLAHGIKQSLMAEAAQSHHKTLSSLKTKASDVAMLSQFAHQEHSLEYLANRRQGMVRETRHVLAETERAQAAIEEKLGGTETGNQIAKLLEKAQAAERQAATGSQKEAKLAIEDVRSVQAMERSFERSTGHVHV